MIALKVFSLNFWSVDGGDSKFSVPDGDEVGWGGGTLQKIWLKPKLPT